MIQADLPFGDARASLPPLHEASADGRRLRGGGSGERAARPFRPSTRSGCPEPAEGRDREIQFVRHARARRYVIRVADDGTVRVTIPQWGSKKQAAAFAGREQAWIEKQQRRIEEERARRLARPELVDGRGEVDRELRERAKRDLPVRLFELASQHGLTVTRVSVRNQRWRWGSCSRSGHICLNWRLVRMPDWVRDYVLIHELMHLKRMDHSRRFWKLVAAACPSFNDARAWLRAHADHGM